MVYITHINFLHSLLSYFCIYLTTLNKWFARMPILDKTLHFISNCRAAIDRTMPIAPGGKTNNTPQKKKNKIKSTRQNIKPQI